MDEFGFIGGTVSWTAPTDLSNATRPFLAFTRVLDPLGIPIRAGLFEVWGRGPYWGLYGSSALANWIFGFRIVVPRPSDIPEFN